jgi:hypothetical protein
MSKKDFKFTIRSNSGKVIAQQIVTFGSKSKPFPEDWRNSGTALKALHDYEREFQQKFAPITYEEGSELDPEEIVETKPDLSFLDKWFEKWEDIEEQSMIEIVLNEAKKMEPIHSANSLHLYEEQYNIDGETYKLIYAIGDDSEPTVQIKKS